MRAIIAVVTMGLTLFMSESSPALNLTPNPATIGDEMDDFTPIRLGNDGFDGIWVEIAGSEVCRSFSVGDPENAWLTVADPIGMPSHFEFCGWVDGSEENKSCVTVNYEPDYIYDGEDVDTHPRDFVWGISSVCFDDISLPVFLPMVVKK